MSNVLPYERKQTILDDLLQDAQNLNYETKKSGIQLFSQKLKNVLPYLTDKHKDKVDEFSKIRFSPGIYSIGGDNTQLFQNTFEIGKEATINFVLGLKHLVDFEQSLKNPQSMEQANLLEELPKTKVFVVHGHDNELKTEVARFIERQSLEAVILHEQISRGQTIIEKIEANSDVGFAIILYTPCDIGRSVSSPEEDAKTRARQNVIFEHGYFVAKLGRSNVIALNKGNVEIPNDLSGVVYTNYDEVGAWKREIAHELKSSGYEIDFSKI